MRYNGANSYSFVNGVEIHKFKAKGSETGKRFTRLFCRQYEKDWILWICLWFNVDFSVIAVDDTLDIPKHLMKKNGIKKCLDLLKKCFYSNDDFQLQCIECHSIDVCLDE